jgi:TPR repeat protein
MRTSDRNRFLPVAVLGLSVSIGLTAAHALDLKTSADSIPVVPGVGPVGGMPGGAQPQVLWDASSARAYGEAVLKGDTEGAVKILENAFRNGDIVAGCKLARNYAYGLDGVRKDQARAFEIFQAVVESQHGSVPAGQSKSFVADALVTMGRYYLTGIPNSAIRAEPARAFNQFYQASVNYASPDAQYLLARAYMDGQGTPKNPALAVKWLFEAAKKENFEAQADVGRLLVKGQVLPLDVPTGLMWLKRAVEAAPQAAAPGIQALYDSAWKQATENERSEALVLIEKWRLRGAPQ